MERQKNQKVAVADKNTLRDNKVEGLIRIEEAMKNADIEDYAIKKNAALELYNVRLEAIKKIISLKEKEINGMRNGYYVSYRDNIQKIESQERNDIKKARIDRRRSLRESDRLNSAKITSLYRTYNLFPKNIISVSFGITYAPSGGVTILGRDLNISYASLSGGVSYSRIINSKLSVFVSAISRGYDNNLNISSSSGRPLNSSTSIVTGVGLTFVRTPNLYLRGSVGLSFTSLYSDYSNYPDPKIREDFVKRVRDIYTVRAGVGLSLGLNFGLILNRKNIIGIGGRVSSGPSIFSYRGSSGIGITVSAGLEAYHRIMINRQLDFVYNISYMFYYNNNFDNFYFRDIYVHIINATIGFGFKF